MNIQQYFSTKKEFTDLLIGTPFEGTNLSTYTPLKSEVADEEFYVHSIYIKEYLILDVQKLMYSAINSEGSQLCEKTYKIRHNIATKCKKLSNINDLYFRRLSEVQPLFKNIQEHVQIILDNIIEDKCTLPVLYRGSKVIIFKMSKSFEQMSLEKIKPFLQDKKYRRKLFNLRQSEHKFSLNFDDTKVLYYDKDIDDFFYIIDDIKGSASTQYLTYSETRIYKDISYEQYYYYGAKKIEKLLESYNYLSILQFKRKKIKIDDMFINIRKLK